MPRYSAPKVLTIVVVIARSPIGSGRRVYRACMYRAQLALITSLGTRKPIAPLARPAATR